MNRHKMMAQNERPTTTSNNNNSGSNSKNKKWRKKPELNVTLTEPVSKKINGRIKK